MTCQEMILKSKQKILKSDSYLPKTFFICFNDSSSKMIKNIFLFDLKSYFRSQDVKFLSRLSVHVVKMT